MMRKFFAAARTIMGTVTAVIAAAFLFASCSISPDDIQVTDVSKLEIAQVGLTQAKIALGIEVFNRSRRDITVSDVLLTIVDPDTGAEIADIVLDKGFTLSKRSETTLALALTVKPKTTLGVLGMAASLNRIEMTNVNYSVKVRSGMMVKTFTGKNIPIRELHGNFVAD